MPTKLSFLGAAQNVTGSRYLVEAHEKRLLVDCGLYQEWELKGRNWEPFSVPPGTLDAVLLTHAHLDHSGLLPKLVHDGFRGPIYATEATAEIAEILLLDSAHLLEEDAEFKRRRHEKEGRWGPYPDLPLYTVEDARATVPVFLRVKYAEEIDLTNGLSAAFYDAGHVLGSSMVRLKIGRDGEERIILFSGDLGRCCMPLLRDPTALSEADYVVVESTYGDRKLESAEEASDRLAEVVTATVKAGGNIIIPSFALERAQELLYFLNQLELEKRIPRLMVFVDSPMAVSITDIFERHPELLDEEMKRLLAEKKSPFDFPGLKLVRTVEESKAINRIVGSIIVIAGSGMCTGGRIKHHLVTNISRPESTILFVGYQAAGTLGRQIVDGAKEVRILGRRYPVRARVEMLNGFSTHADAASILRWLDSLKRPPRRVFITHGEPEAARHLAGLIAGRGWPVAVPAYQEQFILD